MPGEAAAAGRPGPRSVLDAPILPDACDAHRSCLRGGFLERLKELIATADHLLSRLEAEVEADAAPEASLPERMQEAVDAVWDAARRYLQVVDGLEAAHHDEVVATARHTGLLGEAEADEALAVLEEVQAAQERGYEDEAAARNHALFLRLWLERVRDTAAKAA